MILKRVGPSNNRVTNGDVYRSDSDGNITDDKGKNMQAAYTKDKYWLDVSIYESKDPIWDAENPILSSPFAGPNCRCATTALSSLLKVNSNKTEESNKMLTIEKVTLINGRKSEEFSVDKLIDMIAAEEAKVERLDTVKYKSKAIAKLKAKHVANIAALVEHLDGME